MSEQITTSEDDEILAAELAFGLLDTDERRRADQRAATDDAFGAVCAHWRAVAAATVMGTAETPRPSTWTNVRQRVVGQTPNVPLLLARTRALKVWQAATATSTAIAAALAMFMIVRPEAPRSEHLDTPPAVVAVLAGSDPGAVVAISMDRKTGQLTVVPNGFSPSGRAAELWVLPNKGNPISLGLVGVVADRRAVPRMVVGRFVIPGAKFAISIEPLGGSPTGQPTGPIVAQGQASQT